MTILSDVLAALRLNWTTFRQSTNTVRALVYGVRPDGKTQPVLVGTNGELLTNATSGPSEPGGSSAESALPIEQDYYWSSLSGGMSYPLWQLAGLVDGVGVKRALVQAQTGNVWYTFQPGGTTDPNSGAFLLAKGAMVEFNEAEAQSVYFLTSFENGAQIVVLQLFGTGQRISTSGGGEG